MQGRVVGQLTLIKADLMFLHLSKAISRVLVVRQMLLQSPCLGSQNLIVAVDSLLSFAGAATSFPMASMYACLLIVALCVAGSANAAITGKPVRSPANPRGTAKGSCLASTSPWY